jgi:hypothetical protein
MKLQPIITPTGDRRHMPKIRFGKISGEIFTRNPKRREELGLETVLTDPYVIIEELGATAAHKPSDHERPKKRKKRKRKR